MGLHGTVCQDCPNPLNHSLLFVESPIICCENFASFAAYTIGFIIMCRICLVGGVVINIPVLLRPSDNCGCFAVYTFAFTTPMAYPPSPQCLKSMDVKMERSCFPCLSGSPIPRGGPHIASNSGPGGSPYHLRFGLGGGAASAKREARDAQISTCSRPDSQTLAQVKVSKKERNKEKEIGEKKLTVTQGGTPTRDLANGLPCSNQLSYRVTRQLSG